MQTPLDTALLTHPAERHRLPAENERAGRAVLRAKRRAVFRALVGYVFWQAPRHPSAPRALETPLETPAE